MALRRLLDREFGAERYGMPMILLLLSMVAIMATRSGNVAAAIALTLQGLALLATFRAAEVWSLPRLLVSILIVVAMVMGWVRAIFDERIDPAVVPFATAVLVVVATPVLIVGLIRQAKRDGGITVHTLFGTVCIYLLLSLGFASVFAVIALKSDVAFFAQGGHWDSLRDCLYFSLTTITTAGLGDLTPGTDLGRALTASEALIGQIYIVTVVALVVGQVGRRRLRDQ